VPIRALLDEAQRAEGAVFSPEDLMAIVAAYERALERLNIADRKGPLALLVAKTTLQMAKEGELDSKRLSERVIRLHRLSPSI
jgi:hypothetical protein